MRTFSSFMGMENKAARVKQFLVSKAELAYLAVFGL